MRETTETNSRPGDRGSWTAVAVGGLLLAAIAFVAWRQHSESRSVRAELKAMTERLASLAATETSAQRVASDSLQSNFATLRADLTNELNRQGAGMSSLEKEVRRALGHVVIGEAPPDLAVAVRTMVERWLPEEGGQAVPESSEEIRTDIAFVEASMGSGLGEAFRSEIRLLSWWADAVDLHHAAGRQLERAPSVYEWAQSLRLAAPLRAPDWAFGVVMAAERKSSIEVVRLLVSKPLTSAQEIDEAVAILDQFGRELGSDAPAFILEERNKLVAKGKGLEDQSLGQVLGALTTQRAAAIRSAGSERIKLQVQAGFDGQIMGILSSMGEVAPARRRQIENLMQAWQAETRKLEHQIHQREMLRYQVWALGQMDAIYVASKRDCERPLGDDARCQLLKMKEYLVPIDTNLLEPPVREKFTAVWEEWKEQIDSVNDDDMLVKELIKSIGEIPKKGLGEV